LAKTLRQPTRNQHAARKAFDPITEHIKDLVKQVDLIYKLTARTTDLGSELPRPLAGEGKGEGEDLFDARAARRLLKQLDEERKATVEQLKQAAYFHRQVAWLQDRFPKAELEAVPALVKLVDRKDIEAADWSLTPGRYVGVAPLEEDEDFDFEEALREIHTELSELTGKQSSWQRRFRRTLRSLLDEVARLPSG
jgi:type I restriction enzyme M protein